MDCDFEKLDKNNSQCEKTLCPYCEDYMYDAKEERMCGYCDEDRCQVCVAFISEGLYGLIFHPTLFLICFYGLF